MRRSRWLFTVGTLVLALLPLGVTGTARAQEASPTPSPSPVGVGECLTCHGVPEIVAAAGDYRPDLLVEAAVVQESVHGDFTCTTCHSSLLNTMHARRDRARDSCSTCHAAQHDDVEAGYHGEPGQGLKPTCITCHGSHRVKDADTRTFLHRSSAQCARCHEQMSQQFEGGNVFGMETHLAGPEVATCVDCHGSHTVLPRDDPRSPVNEANLLGTCRQCHENAPANFVDVQMHLGEGPIPEDPRLRWATIYMLTLLIGTFGFFGYLTILGIRHEWRHGRPKGATG